MEVLESNCGDNACVSLYDCAYGSLNFSNMLSGCIGFNNKIYHYFIYGIVKIHVHEDSLYYHSNSGIYCHNSF